MNNMHRPIHSYLSILIIFYPSKLFMFRFECAKPQFPCNCDAADSVVRKDAGYVTSREDVPIRTFNIKATGKFQCSSAYKTNIAATFQQLIKII